MTFVGLFASVAGVIAVIGVVVCIDITLSHLGLITQLSTLQDDRIRDIELRLGKLELRDAAVSDPWTEDLI